MFGRHGFEEPRHRRRSDRLDPRLRNYQASDHEANKYMSSRLDAEEDREKAQATAARHAAKTIDRSLTNRASFLCSDIWNVD